MALYILYYTLYLHQPFIFSPVFRRKVHSSREAIVKSPQLRALICFFPDVLPNLGIEMADTSYRNSISTRINTHTREHNHAHTLTNSPQGDIKEEPGR